MDLGKKTISASPREEIKKANSVETSVTPIGQKEPIVDDLPSPKTLKVPKEDDKEVNKVQHNGEMLYTIKLVCSIVGVVFIAKMLGYL